MVIRKKTHKIDKKQVIDAFSEMAKAKNIEKDLLQGIIEETLSLIVKKKYGNNADFEIVVNMEKGDLEIYLIKQVVESVEDPETEISVEEANKYSIDKLEIGDDFIEEITLDNIADSFGRRLVAYASQAINQKIHEVERNNVYLEYSNKIGQMIVGEIFQKRAFMMLVVHNGTEMKLMRDDQLPSDNIFYKKNKAIKAVIKNITNNKGTAPEIFLSRKSDDFVRRLFELEVPEVNDGIVQIKAIAREAGERMKIALSSGVDRIDPIGACVGMKGIRINSIIRELGNENIDLIPWVDDIRVMIEKALLPAKVKEVEIFPDTRTATVIIPDDQIPLAVGRNGLNIRLACRLTEYDIKLLKEGGEDIEIHEFSVELGESMLEKLLENGIETAREFLEASPDVLVKDCKMNYEMIVEVRRIMLIEFDETEDSNYIAKLREVTGESVEEETIKELEVSEVSEVEVSEVSEIPEVSEISEVSEENTEINNSIS
jgi:N utilization substance protein A